MNNIKMCFLEENYKLILLLNNFFFCLETKNKGGSENKRTQNARYYIEQFNHNIAQVEKFFLK